MNKNFVNITKIFIVLLLLKKKVEKRVRKIRVRRGILVVEFPNYSFLMKH